MIRTWTDGWGVACEDKDPEWPSVLHIFNGTLDTSAAVIERSGSCYGVCVHGTSLVNQRIVRAGQFFQTRLGVDYLFAQGLVVVMQRTGYLGVEMVGGPLERKGRLRYIDGCSDTLLVPPQVRGEPCLNFLHFPPGIDQTMHTHPSTRFGVVMGGRGVCVTPESIIPLFPGVVFWLPKDTKHKFRTTEEHMDIVAYHPDSDFGPTHEDHPMLNRTLVGGAKMDNRQFTADVVNPWL